ncbi:MULTISPECIES: hypothetical protein [Acidianus]|uniref:DUF3291 domain-containing protein n=1 Tax=Candidatus Acidianus copahuensis TaxID=1160895 RepID=A0A031LP88_9CREN|nr:MULTISPECIES: hypothetical protein [Acidianus]EZQ10187.1 hypothetical protein CM19_04380 [Candidatus Acidianus copahuensis]NON62991.1 hypothetical protein [Acidianus sp. RZ1]
MIIKYYEIPSNKDINVENGKYIVIATYLNLRGTWNIIPFLILVKRVESQLRVSKGIIRYSLGADILHRRFWTISVWTNKEDISLFLKTPSHKMAIYKFYKWGGEVKVTQWISPAGTIDWKDALSRLENPDKHYTVHDGNFTSLS